VRPRSSCAPCSPASSTGSSRSPSARRRPRPLGREGGFGLIAKDRYLTLIAALMVLLNIVNTTGEYLFG
jgi:AAA family ATP:ADP antiporter